MAKRATIGLLAALSLCGAGFPQETGQNQQDLASARLEDLMKVEVTSVSKQEQTLSTTAAAVFVITQEDIQQSGARNIPDLLRRRDGRISDKADPAARTG